MKKLGFSLMRMPTLDKTNQADVDIEQIKALVDRYPRDSFTLATKLHAGFFNSLEEREKVFYGQLEKNRRGVFRLLSPPRHRGLHAVQV